MHAGRLEVGAAESDSPIGSYAAALAFATLGEWDDVRPHADVARTHASFPSAVADALAFIAAEDVVGYVEAVEEVLESFETRDAYLEDVPVADTVLVLQALAGRAAWRPSSSRSCCLEAAGAPVRRRLTVLPLRGACRRRFDRGRYAYLPFDDAEAEPLLARLPEARRYASAHRRPARTARSGARAARRTVSSRANRHRLGPTRSRWPWPAPLSLRQLRGGAAVEDRDRPAAADQARRDLAARLVREGAANHLRLASPSTR